MKLLIIALLSTIAITSATEKSLAAPKPPAGSTSQLPQKLPAKKKATKRTYIDMSEAEGVVIAPRNPTLNKALQKSEVQKTEAEVRVQSRVFVPAPPGDLSELPSLAPTPVAKAPIIKAPIAKAPIVSKSVLPPIDPVAQAKAWTESQIVLPPIPIEPLHEFSQPKAGVVAKTASEVTDTTVPEKESGKVDDKIVDAEAAMNEEKPTLTETTVVSTFEAKKILETENTPQTLAFVRTGYLQAKYGKFDSRMKDGATYVGLGVAREFETAWGSFEARASIDAYHAMDQSVTVDNIRMLATRTEVGYWFTRTRVRPGISLGLGWTDYSVRSYRSVGQSTSQSVDQTVVLKTHAKSQAFTVIPGTSLRIEVADGLVIDTQTEFLGILGGDSADAVQGLSFGVALGWIF